jgi:hypothetical protein
LHEKVVACWCSTASTGNPVVASRRGTFSTLERDTFGKHTDTDTDTFGTVGKNTDTDTDTFGTVGKHTDTDTDTFGTVGKHTDTDTNTESSDTWRHLCTGTLGTDTFGKYTDSFETETCGKRTDTFGTDTFGSDTFGKYTYTFGTDYFDKLANGFSRGGRFATCFPSRLSDEDEALQLQGMP